MSNNIPKQGEIYRHYKGNLYQITAVALHTETEEKMVVYQALYGDFKYYVRPLEMFMEQVKIEDKFINRFELVNMNNNKENDICYNKKNDVHYIEKNNLENKKENSSDQVIIFNYKEDEDTEDEKENLSCDLMGFLDAKTYTEKMNILKEMRVNGDLDEHILRNCALSIDCIVDENGIDEQYHSIMNCLNMLSKYECTRFR